MTDQRTRMTSVGVVIPTFERVEETIRAAASAASQQGCDVRVVVVDDGSSEATRTGLVHGLEPLGVPLVQAVHTGHPGRVRNRGVAELDTEWVAFLDSDDEWHPDKLSRQLEAADRTGAVAVCGNADRLVDGVRRGQVLDSPPSRIRFADLVRMNRVINSTAMVRSETLRAVGGIAESYVVRGAEDYATWLRIASSTDWLCLAESLCSYTDDPAVSIRGTEAFSSHPAQHAAWLDYMAWRREVGSPLRGSERVVEKILGPVLRREGARHPR